MRRDKVLFECQDTYCSSVPLPDDAVALFPRGI